MVRNFNQDPDGARNINPTCLQFESVYETLLVGNLCSNHSLGANCEEDTNKMLHNLDYLLLKHAPQPSGSHEVIVNSSIESSTKRCWQEAFRKMNLL